MNRRPIFGCSTCRTAEPSTPKVASRVQNGSSRVTPADTSTLPEKLLTSFLLTGEHSQSYKQQYANIYFMRLAKLKSVVLENAKRKWSDVAGASLFDDYPLLGVTITIDLTTNPAAGNHGLPYQTILSMFLAYWTSKRGNFAILWERCIWTCH